jgi:hypothetical protein
MSKIDQAMAALGQIEDQTERALELAGLISTLFKLRGVVLVVTGELAYASYADAPLPHPEVELAPLTGKLAPRLAQEIMSGQLGGEGAIGRWVVAGLPVRLYSELTLSLRELCRDFNTDHGVVKLSPAEEITADRILSSVYPVFNPVAHREVIRLLINGLTDAFRMDWIALRKICHLPEYRVGEELAQFRTEAKQRADTLGLTTDPVDGKATGRLPDFNI